MTVPRRIRHRIDADPVMPVRDRPETQAWAPARRLAVVLTILLVGTGAIAVATLLGAPELAIPLGTSMALGMGFSLTRGRRRPIRL